jgi:hypothetical protein
LKGWAPSDLRQLAADATLVVSSFEIAKRSDFHRIQIALALPFQGDDFSHVPALIGPHLHLLALLHRSVTLGQFDLLLLRLLLAQLVASILIFEGALLAVLVLQGPNHVSANATSWGSSDGLDD